MTITITVRRAGGLLQALLQGEVLCTADEPFLQAARILLERGTDPATPIAMRWEGSDSDSLTSTVGYAAKLEVGTNSTGRPVFRPYRPRT
jgi:hypothetical protein